MPEKQKARGWKGPHTAIAIVAMLMQVALCNIFAGVDRQHIPENAALSIMSSAAPTIATQPDPADVVVDGYRRGVFHHPAQRGVLPEIDSGRIRREADDSRQAGRRIRHRHRRRRRGR